MEITLDKKENNEGLIKVTLVEEDYQPKVDQKVKEYSKKAQLKGFRPGKVPPGVIKKMYGKSILVEEINNLLSSSLSEYIQKNDIKLIGEPLPEESSVESIDWDNQKEFNFEYAVGILDDFKLPLSDKTKVTKHLIKVDDKILNATIDDVKKQYGKREEPESASEESEVHVDMVSVDNPDEEFKHIPVDLKKTNKKESARFIGAKKGDEVTFDFKKLFKDHPDISNILGIADAELKKIKGEFKATVLHIYNISPAEINQELFDKVFGKDKVKDEKEFREKVKETVASNYERESTALLQRDIKDKLIEETKINMPENFVKRWLSKGSRANLSIEQVEKNFDIYVKELKWSFIQNRIATENKLDVSYEEIVDYTKQMMASQFGGSIPPELEPQMDAFASNYLQGENGQNYARIQEQLFNGKIMDHIMNTVSIAEKSVDLDTFKKKANS